MGRKIRNATADKNVDFQVESGMGSTLLKTGVSLGSQAINSTIGKKLIDKGINSIPNIFCFGRKKVKNKKLKKILKSDVADLVVSEAQKKSGKNTTIYSKQWGEFQMDKLKKRLGI